MAGTAQTYRVFLLRFWRAPGAGQGWRAALEDPRTGRRIGFPDLPALLAFLDDLHDDAAPPSDSAQLPDSACRHQQ